VVKENNEKRVKRQARRRGIVFLAPIQIELPNKLGFTFEVIQDEIGRFGCEEEFPDQKLVKNSMEFLKRLYEIPGVSISRDGCKIVMTGEVPVKIGIGVLLSEVLKQAIFYLGKEGIERVLEMFQVESGYISKEKFREALRTREWLNEQKTKEEYEQKEREK